MEKAVTYQGLNGEDHRFTRADMTNFKALPRGGGVVVVARDSSEPVYIAEAHCVWELLTQAGIWHRAQHDFGATAVYVIPSRNSNWCRNVADNLRNRYSPPMNR